jgi:hypothetical protein
MGGGGAMMDGLRWVGTPRASAPQLSPRHFGNHACTHHTGCLACALAWPTPTNIAQRSLQRWEPGRHTPLCATNQIKSSSPSCIRVAQPLPAPTGPRSSAPKLINTCIQACPGHPIMLHGRGPGRLAAPRPHRPLSSAPPPSTDPSSPRSPRHPQTVFADHGMRMALAAPITAAPRPSDQGN